MRKSGHHVSKCSIFFLWFTLFSQVVVSFSLLWLCPDTWVFFAHTCLSVFSCSFSLPDWMLFLMRNIYCSPIPSGADLFSPDLKTNKQKNQPNPTPLYSYFLSSYPLFLTMPFSLPFILLFLFLFFFTSFSTTSLLPLLLPPWAPQPVFHVSPTHISHLFVLSSLWPCLTDVLPFLCQIGLSAGFISSWGREKCFVGSWCKPLFLVESQTSYSAKWLQPHALVQWSWIKDLRTPCLLWVSWGTMVAARNV